MAKAATSRVKMTSKPVSKTTSKTKITEKPEKKLAIVRTVQKQEEIKMPQAMKSSPKLSVITSKLQERAKQTAARAEIAKNNKNNDEFKVGAHVVYPTHGVGMITGIEKQSIGGHELSLYVIAFDKDKMTLRVPVTRAKVTGLRALSDNGEIEKAMYTLKQKAKVAKGMWSKRAQEYESKINSGNIIFLAEVVRDLHRNVDHPERSYSERVIYENAFNRLAREIAAVEEMDHQKAIDKLVKFLAKKIV